MQRLRLRLLASLVVMMFIVSAPGSAAAFGTIDTGGQHREHERITRAALSCAGTPVRTDCFEPTSVDYPRGARPEFGAVGAPDSDECSIRPRIATTPTSSRAAIRVPAIRPPRG